MAIEYVLGDAGMPDSAGAAVIIHLCNDLGLWATGFMPGLARRWPQARTQYLAWHSGALAVPFAPGEVQFVLVAPDLWVANLIGQQGVRPVEGVPPIRYAAVQAGLARVGMFARLHGASAHIPRLGWSLAGGNWDRLAAIIELELAAKDIPVRVYDPF